jgi:hypothetical protein
VAAQLAGSQEGLNSVSDCDDGDDDGDDDDEQSYVLWVITLCNPDYTALYHRR